MRLLLKVLDLRASLFGRGFENFEAFCWCKVCRGYFKVLVGICIVKTCYFGFSKVKGSLTPI